MPHVQVRDVPPEVLENLKARASREGRSLQSYLLELLTSEAAVESNDRLLESAAGNAWRVGAPDETASLVGADREARGRSLVAGR